MSDQAKRRRSRSPDSINRENTPGPSSKVRRRGQTAGKRAGEESDSSDSSASEIVLPESVRRILDFEQWGRSTSTSSSEEDTDEAPSSIPLRPYSEPEVPTPTGADFTDFTDFSTQTWSPTCYIPSTPTIRTESNAHPSGNAAIYTPGTMRAADAGVGHSDDELTGGYITETDRGELTMQGWPREAAVLDGPGSCDTHDWTPPPKRQRNTPSSTGAAGATLLDETDESDREHQGIHEDESQPTTLGGGGDRPTRRSEHDNIAQTCARRPPTHTIRRAQPAKGRTTCWQKGTTGPLECSETAHPTEPNRQEQR